MPKDYEQRTFLPDEDVDYESLWPPPTPPPPREYAPMREWLPVAIVLVCVVVSVLTMML